MIFAFSKLMKISTKSLKSKKWCKKNYHQFWKVRYTQTIKNYTKWKMESKALI